jgi:hypothetical protein
MEKYSSGNLDDPNVYSQFRILEEGGESTLPYVRHSITLIEDKLKLVFVIGPNEFDTGISDVLVRQSYGKFSVMDGTGTADGTTPPLSSSSLSSSSLSSETLHCVNIATYSSRGRYIVACTNDVKHAFFMSTSFFEDNRTIANLLDQTIAYVCLEDLEVMTNILKCYKLPKNKIKFVHIQLTDFENLDVVKPPFDCIFLFINNNDPRYDFLRTRKMSLYSYNDIHIDLAKKWMPCAQWRYMNVSRYFPRYVGPFQINLTMETRNIIYASSPVYNYLYDLVIQFFSENFEYLNFYQRFYQLHPRTLKFQREKNAYFTENRMWTRPILEQFHTAATDESTIVNKETTPVSATPVAVTPVSVTPPVAVTPVAVTPVSVTPVAVTPTIPTTPAISPSPQATTVLKIEEDDSSYLRAQEGKDRRMVFRPIENINGTLIPEDNLFFYDSDILLGTPLMVGDRVELNYQIEVEENGKYVVMLLQDTGALLERMHPRFPVNIDNDDDDEFDDETYFCVTNPSLLYKHECLGAYDQFGFPKQHVDVWDGPCKSSLECPFFTYDSSRKRFDGRCVNGYCSMPMGYTRIGFKKFINQDGDQWLNMEPRPRQFATPSTSETRW